MKPPQWLVKLLEPQPCKACKEKPFGHRYFKHCGRIPNWFRIKLSGTETCVIICNVCENTAIRYFE